MFDLAAVFDHVMPDPPARHLHLTSDLLRLRAVHPAQHLQKVSRTAFLKPNTLNSKVLSFDQGGPTPGLIQLLSSEA